MMKKYRLFGKIKQVVFFVLILFVGTTNAQKNPYLKKSGNTTQLMVHDKPNLKIYPAPKGTLASEVFLITVNNKPCPVYKTGVYKNDFSYFDFQNGPVKVEVTVLDSLLAAKFRRGCVVRPLSKEIKPTVNGNVISFVLTEPSKITVEPAEYIGDRWESEIRLGPLLYLFTNSMEKNRPDPKSKDVVYFRPGFHDHTKTPIVLKSNTTYYIAGGAWVRAKALKGNGVENVKICGNGVLEITGSGNSIHLADCRNITFEGLTYLSHGEASMIHKLNRCRNISFDNYKIIGGSSHWYDGIHLEGTDSVTINNCFIRADDDPIAVYSDWTNPDGPLFSGNVTVTNSIISNPGQGNLCRIGWWEYGRITRTKNLLFKNIDIIHQGTGNITYDNSLVDFSEASLDRPVDYENITFEDINVEDCSRVVRINLENSKGSIKGLKFKNINFMTQPRRVSYLGVNNFDFITFENLRINGKEITNLCEFGVTLAGEAALHPEKIIFINGHTPQVAPKAPSELNRIEYINRSLQIDLNWTDNSDNETGFIIERKAGDDGMWNQITTVGKNVTYFTDNNVLNNTKYYYRVKANNGELNSDYSNEVNANAIMESIAIVGQNNVNTDVDSEIFYKPTTSTNPVNLTLVNIPGGTFTMGSPATEVNHESDEVEYQVTLSAFRMSKYEITNAQYAAFLNAKNIGSDGKYAAGAYPTQKLIYASSGSYNWGLNYTGGQWVPVAGYENHPAIFVSWFGATEFATYAGGTLPTEAQWEYACRGGTTTAFNTGTCLTDAQANYDWAYPQTGCTNTVTTYSGTTQAVGTYAANAYGLHDMHGNVWEWCSDWYGTYPTTSQKNPTGATTGSGRVIRGGGWGSRAQVCRSASRNSFHPRYYHPGISDIALGFRVVLVP